MTASVRPSWCWRNVKQRSSGNGPQELPAQIRLHFELEDTAHTLRALPRRNGAGARLEVEGYFASEAARRYVVRAAEIGEEVIEGVFVGYIDRSELEINLVPVGAEEVGFADGDVEEISRRNARGIVIVVSGAGRGDSQQRGAVLRCRAKSGQRMVKRCLLAVADEAGLELLVRSEAAQD